MKQFDELTPDQKTKAIAFAYNHLETSIMSGVVVVTFKNSMDNRLLLGAMRRANRDGSIAPIYEVLSKRQSIKDELMETARMAAETAFYAEENDYVVEGVI